MENDRRVTMIGQLEDLFEWIESLRPRGDPGVYTSTPIQKELLSSLEKSSAIMNSIVQTATLEVFQTLDSETQQLILFAAIVPEITNGESFAKDLMPYVDDYVALDAAMNKWVEEVEKAVDKALEPIFTP